MSHPSPFKWRHFEAEIILLCVRCTPPLVQLRKRIRPRRRSPNPRLRLLPPRSPLLA